MNRKWGVLALCAILGVLAGCGSASSVEESQAIAQTSNVEVQAAPVNETGQSLQAEEMQTAPGRNGETEESPYSKEAAESHSGETENMSDEEVEELINNITFTYTTRDYEMTEEELGMVMPKLKEAIRFINRQWEETIAGNVSLTKILMQVLGTDNERKVRGFVLTYVPINQSDSFSSYHFSIAFMYDKPSVVMKYWEGENANEDTDIPINTIIS